MVESRHVILVRDESLSEATLTKRQFHQRSSINNDQCPNAECPEDFANFSQKRFVLVILGPIRIDGEEIPKGYEKNAGSK